MKSETDRVRFATRTGRKAVVPKSTRCANSGSRSRGLLDQIAAAARRNGASLWKSCFAETIEKHLRPLTTTSYHFRYSQIGLILKDLGHRLPSFCISP